MTCVTVEGMVSYVLGLLAFLAVCIVAAMFPTLTAYVIFGVVAVMAVGHFRDRVRESARFRKGK